MAKAEKLDPEIAQAIAQDTRREPGIIIDGMPFTKTAVLAMENGKDIWAQGVARRKAERKRQSKRGKIRQRVADAESLLGTTADAAQIAIVAMLIDVIALDAAKDFAGYKSTKLKLMDELLGSGKTDALGVASPIWEKLTKSKIRLPAMAKGVPAALDEIMARATEVADILAEDEK